MPNQGRKTFTIQGQDFVVQDNFEIIKELGQGAYGIVVSARNMVGDAESVAIKKVTNVFSKRILAKRCLREVKLLQHFRDHKNITCLYDMDIVDHARYNELYLYEELMEADLHAIIRSGQPLTDAHYQSFIYQILCGLKYIHSANVLHRDLKPGNILVNADCELKICDFGLARGYSDVAEENAGFMTEYVATRWYRAPEIMLSFQSYSKAIDLWSVGCILAELLGGRPFFKGRDYVDQLNQILHVLGTPAEPTLNRIGSQRAQDYVRGLPFKAPIPFASIFPKASGLAIDLLTRLLQFDPADRINVEQALAHPYLAVWHDPAEEPVCPQVFDFGFEQVDDIDEMRSMISQEVVSFRQQVRSHAIPTANAASGIQIAAAGASAAAAAGSGVLEEPPKPQSAEDERMQENDLEAALAGGMDLRR
ncbi:MAP protein kinase [Protomyces lactucae-debilis]|uniref:Mitogen-activated protein kinase n=1 Tax=Protomyces lactucae-debilis TaxID=2754530 RepID=A0A1Y2FIL0_PROLT|nr:MAP protein kinase [Protomyces lactucae-debilis]ORY83779.1 MAP protein kinase [Protomyces lactucae-debilis]